jgi:hypothetical protein
MAMNILQKMMTMRMEEVADEVQTGRNEQRLVQHRAANREIRNEQVYSK